MKRFEICITAHTHESMVMISDNKFYADNISGISFHKTTKPFLGWLKTYYPLIDWVIDDGDDNNDSTYVQYVAYTEGKENMDNYILADLMEIDENGYVK